MFRNALRRFGTAVARPPLPKLLQTPGAIAVGWDSAVSSRLCVPYSSIDTQE